MSTAQLLVAGCLTALAAAHSILGETDILRPLFAAEWSMSKTPRWATERILRFAWHLTSLAWVALSLAVLDVALLPAVGVMSIVSAAIIFVMLRGHLAWPLFLLAGIAAFHAEGLIDDWIYQTASAVTATVALAAAALHVYWAFGGTWMLDRALPTTHDSASSNFEPGPLLTLAVAGALAAFAVLIGLAALDAGPEQARWLVIAAIAILVVRAIGDTKVAGFTKTIRDTAFAQADDRWFTPLIVFLAFGATGSLLI